MVRKVKIIDATTGEQLREEYSPVQKLLFGFLSPTDFLKLGGAIVAVIVFFINGQNDKRLMQSNLTAMQITVSRLTDFRDNSDNFNTLAYNTKFKNGEPVDQSFKVNNRGSVPHQ